MRRNLRTLSTHVKTVTNPGAFQPRTRRVVRPAGHGTGYPLALWVLYAYTNGEPCTRGDIRLSCRMCGWRSAQSGIVQRAMVGEHLVLPVPSHHFLSPSPQPLFPHSRARPDRAPVNPSRCGFSTDTRRENPVREGMTGCPDGAPRTPARNACCVRDRAESWRLVGHWNVESWIEAALGRAKSTTQGNAGDCSWRVFLLWRQKPSTDLRGAAGAGCGYEDLWVAAGDG